MDVGMTGTASGSKASFTTGKASGFTASLQMRGLLVCLFCSFMVPPCTAVVHTHDRGMKSTPHHRFPNFPGNRCEERY